jgi:hypothetical protein
MQICSTCGAKNIDNLADCWQCRRPLEQSSAPDTVATLRYRARPRGVRPAVGFLMLIVFAAGIGAWWYLRPPGRIELPPRFAGEPEVNRKASLQVTDVARDRMDIGVAVARYGLTAENFPKYVIVAFRDLRPPFTASYLLNDWRSYIPAGSLPLESRLVIKREIDGVRFRCHRVRQQENLVAMPGAPFRWCSWQLGDVEAGILVDRISREISTTLKLTQRARDLVT